MQYYGDLVQYYELTKTVEQEMAQPWLRKFFHD